MQTEHYRANIRKENFDSQPILKCYSIEISSNSKTLTKMNIRLSFSLQRLKALLKTETYEYGFKERISENWSYNVSSADIPKVKLLKTSSKII